MLILAPLDSHTYTLVFMPTPTHTHTHSPPDNHAVDFPATFDIDGGNSVRGNTAAGSTRIAFRYAGEPCLDDNTSPTYDEVCVVETMIILNLY